MIMYNPFKKHSRAEIPFPSDVSNTKSLSPRLPSVPMQPINISSPDEAMLISAVYRCTSILSGTIASLPLLIKRKKSGYYSADYENELYSLLTRNPNNRMNSFEMMRNSVIQMINWGNAYIVIQRTFGNVSGLILCANNTVVYDKLNNVYTINDPYNRIYGRYEAYEIIHLKNNSLDGGYTGVSTIAYATRILSISASADNQSLRTFQNGSKIKGLISGIKNQSITGISALTGEQVEPVSNRIEEQFNSGKDIVSIPEDTSFQQLSINPVDAQLLETKKFGVLEVCRFYGVDPDKVFVDHSDNYKASEMNNVNFLTNTLQPILKQIEAEFNSKLIASSVGNIYQITFDLSALYQTDLTTQAAYYSGMVNAGLSTPNEVRMKLGYPPIEGGDKAYMSCNTYPMDSEPPKTNEIKV